MKDQKVLNFVRRLLTNRPPGWLTQTTHRLDVYNEPLAKVEFLEQLEALYKTETSDETSLSRMSTAYDYIRLGHPLSCVLEWAVARLNGLQPTNVISFSSQSMAALAVLRKNLLIGKKTRIVHFGAQPVFLDAEVLNDVYNYQFNWQKVAHLNELPSFDGSTILISQDPDLCDLSLDSKVDFLLCPMPSSGSLLLVSDQASEAYVSDVQHVRRRETIAMTPANCLVALQELTGQDSSKADPKKRELAKDSVIQSIQMVTGTETTPLLGNCGLSVQYAIVMGLIDHALATHPGKPIKIVVPPNCYGGTNDQARRVAACVDNVEVVDLPVDSGSDMVQSTEIILDQIAVQDGVPLIIAEIPTNPRVEVPDLMLLKQALGKERQTPSGNTATPPIFILDQTFCPNFHFLGDGEILSSVQTISYVSGSKFPSGGKCTAGYCVANKKSESLMTKIETHLKVCDNEATNLQLEILSEQMPSMNERIREAYHNTREFVNFIMKTLPQAKINFVSEELAEQGFTPSVFSLDLPAKGDSAQEKESYKRELNHKLINMMIDKIPEESQHCVSYGQLKGCYWTIPATSTQGTTKEGDKDYIVRVSVAPKMDVERHKSVFSDFVKTL